MSLETFFVGPDAARFLNSFAECLAAVGTERFNTRFLSLIETIIRADQCRIFAFENSRPNCYLSFNTRHNQRGANTTESYLQSGYLEDPAVEQLQAMSLSGVRVFTLSDLRPEMSEAYFHENFAARGIGDKVCVIAPAVKVGFVMNFYRFHENGPFGVSDDALRLPFWTLISQLVIRHYSSARQSGLTSPLNSLSAREKSICEHILRGRTTEAIAWETGLAVSSVKTYRQRAYAKLGINSKSALFSVCGRGG